MLNYGDFLLTKIGCFRLTLFGDFLLTLTPYCSCVIEVMSVVHSAIPRSALQPGSISLHPQKTVSPKK